MSLGEGLKFHSDENYFGTWADARIISLLDENGTDVDGGLIIDERATLNGTEYVTELLRIRDSEFKWKGNTIWHGGNFNPSNYLPKSAGSDNTLTGTLYLNNITTSDNSDLTVSTASGNLYLSPHGASTYINWGDRGVHINGYANGGQHAAITTKNNCHLSFDTRGALDQLFLNNSGKVGINTSTPNCLLEVAGTRANPDTTSIASSAMFAVGHHNNDGLFFGYGTGSDYGWIQSGYYGNSSTPTSQHAYPISLNPLGGNIYILERLVVLIS